MEELKINTSLQVNKLAALDQSKIVNLSDEERKLAKNRKDEESTEAERKRSEDLQVQTEKLVEMANRFVQRFSTKITFFYDPQQNKSKILVTEKGTGRVIREIPPEQMVDLMNKIEEIAGIIYNGRV